MPRMRKNQPEMSDICTSASPLTENDSAGLCTLEEIALWRQANNPGVLVGYRREQNARAAIASTCACHNETANVWIHIAAFVWVVFMCFYQPLVRIPSLPNTDSYDVLAWMPMLIGAACCFFGSIVCHTFESSENQKDSINAAKGDYLGIVSIMWGGTTCLVCYFFYCSLVWKIVYISILSIICVVVIYLLLDDRFGQPENLQKRTVVFGSMWIAVIVPFIHFFVFVKDPEEDKLKFGLLLGGGILLQACGGFFFSTQWPESKIKSEWFSWFGSHSMFHVLNSAGVVVLYFATDYALEYHSTLTCNKVV